MYDPNLPWTDFLPGATDYQFSTGTENMQGQWTLGNDSRAWVNAQQAHPGAASYKYADWHGQTYVQGFDANGQPIPGAFSQVQTDTGNFVRDAAAVIAGGYFGGGALAEAYGAGAGTGGAALGGGEAGAAEFGAGYAPSGAATNPALIESAVGTPGYGVSSAGAGGGSGVLTGPTAGMEFYGGEAFNPGGMTDPSFGAGADFARAGGSMMNNGAAILSGAQLVSGLGAAYSGGRAGQNASAAQYEAAMRGAGQFQPWQQAGTAALTQQQALAGLAGPEAQKAAIAALEGSPEFSALTQNGEDAILANASATGGLRGGNVQAALAQFRPQVLAKLISEQFSRLQSLSGQGLNATGASGNLLQQAGAAQAGGALAQGKANAGYWGALTSALGLYAGLSGGF